MGARIKERFLPRYIYKKFTLRVCAIEILKSFSIPR
jgi:hypothetical protein